MHLRTRQEREQLREDILSRLREYGADCCGIAPVRDLQNGPSETLFPRMKDQSRDHFAGETTTGLPHGAVLWEPDAVSVIVYGIAHPEDQPQMDWWCGELDPPGNRRLLAVSRQIKAYLNREYPDIAVYSKRYHVERGGIYLKDAAVRAGLGCIGRNNLLITPEYGPRVRLRALLISEELPPDYPLDFDPCSGCAAPCRTSCPQNAFAKQIYTPEEEGSACLPGRDGYYFRGDCHRQMLRNEAEAEPGMMPEVCDHPEKIIKYCRNCEINCVVGRKIQEAPAETTENRDKNNSPGREPGTK